MVVATAVVDDEGIEGDGVVDDDDDGGPTCLGASSVHVPLCSLSNTY